MQVIGIDPGLRLTGYAWIDTSAGAARPKVVEAGVFRLPAGLPLAERLVHLHDDLATLLDEASPDLVAVESVFTHHRYPRTSMLMGHARGVVLLLAQLRSIALEELAPAEVKKAATGHGNASKRQVQLAVAAQCNLATPPTPSDVADAIAIACCAARRHEVPAVVDAISA